MFHLLNDHHTICALATASGGAIGVIRISGPEAIALVDKTFVAVSGWSLQAVKGQSVSYGNIITEDRSVIDEVLVTVFRSPHSYTGEDVVEVSCHGSEYILKEVLRRLIDLGCRQARPGEFTQRAS